MSDTSPDDIIICRHDSVAFAPQPTEADLDAWAEQGVKLVINSRTPGELAGLPFDMPSAVESRGMSYLSLPLGGTYPATPALTVALGKALDETDGPVVMHCKSGMRSAHLYAAHLKSRDRSLAEPLDIIGWPGGRDAQVVAALTVPDNG